MHLSLSGSELELEAGGVGEDTANTTLTEGKFLKGLETSIEVLAANQSKYSDSDK